VAIPLTSESAPAPVAFIDGDQMLIVESREDDPKLVALVREAEEPKVERGMVAAGGGRKGKRAEYRCATCGYGIVVYERPPGCPMCREARWEHLEWQPFSQLDGLDLPVGTRSQRRRLRAPFSPIAERADPLPSPGSSRSIRPEK
jgi:hypothetical protein